MVEPTPVKEACDEVYDRCKDAADNSPEGLNKTFSQKEIIELCDSDSLKHIKNAHTLLPIVTDLCHRMLFIPLKSKSGSSWCLRRRDVAKLVKQLDRDELMVYQVIEESYEDGIWIKNIRKRSGINDNKGMEKLIGKLQRMSLIKSVKNVKAPNQKTYMLHHLAPSDDVTGGSFYDAGDLDESLVEEISNLIVFHVRQMSWVEDRKRRFKKESSPILVRDDEDQTVPGVTSERGRNKKRKRNKGTTAQTIDIEESNLPHKHRSHKAIHDPETDSGPNQLAFSAGHEYPTTESIHKYLIEGGIIRGVKAQSLTTDEIQNIVNVLVWDEKLEEVNGGYRTVRGVMFKHPGEEDDDVDEEERKRGNGLTEAPCGRCPVIDLCGTGGLINAATCVYFDQWLHQGTAAAAG